MQSNTKDLSADQAEFEKRPVLDTPPLKVERKLGDELSDFRVALMAERIIDPAVGGACISFWAPTADVARRHQEAVGPRLPVFLRTSVTPFAIEIWDSRLASERKGVA